MANKLGTLLNVLQVSHNSTNLNGNIIGMYTMATL